jgi:hypothetical protein
MAKPPTFTKVIVNSTNIFRTPGGRVGGRKDTLSRLKQR